MELRLRLLLTLAAATTLWAAAPPLQAALPALQALQARGARISAVVVDAGDGSVIESLAPDTRLTPASLTKLVAAAAVLDRWPGDKVFVTRLLGRGEVHDGVLQGDLVLRGDGDSSLDAEKLWSLAVQLRTRGLRAVTGRLVVEPGPFGTLPCETADRCEGESRTDRSYNALLSGIGLDYGNWCVEVRAPAEGGPASLRGCGGLPLPLPVEGRVATGAVGSRESLRVERLTVADGDRLRVGGSLPAGSTERVYRAMSDPTLATGQLLRGLLRELGIAVAGGTVVMPASAAPPAAAANGASSAPPGLLAEVESLPLREQVARMMRYSNNYMADVLTLDLAAEVDGVAPLRLSSASAVLQAWLARAPQSTPAATGPQGPTSPPITGNTPLITSGSGLTPENRLSARDLTGLLQRMYHDPRRFPAFYGSLVVPRDAPFPYLRRGDAAWLDRVALKTGTLTEPYSVTGIAGYARKRDGGFLAFAVIVNGSDARRVIPAAEALAAARDDLVRVLARY